MTVLHVPHSLDGGSSNIGIQGYLAHEKTHPPRTLPWPMPGILWGS